VLTQQVAVEATGIIAREKRDELAHRQRLSSEYLDHCAAFIYRPGISVVPAARVATATARIHAMHDPTEGGLATGLWELAAASGLGLRIDASMVPIFPETRRLCDIYGLDPWGIIASGSLLLTLAPGDAARVCDALGAAGIPATVIGWVRPPEDGVTLCSGTGPRHPCGDEEPGHTVTEALPLPRFARDEIAKLFE
jgi:hydrogenase maturation factor